MKRKEIKELSTKTTKELWASIKTLRTEIARLSLDLAQNKVGNVRLLRSKKDDIARMLTAISERSKAKKA